MKKISKILILLLVASTSIGFSFPLKISEGAEQAELPLLVKEEKPAKISRPLYVPDEIIVKFKGGTAKTSIEKLFREQGAAEKYESKFAQFKVLKIPATKNVPELVEIFKKSPFVEYAEPNYYAYATMRPNDPWYWNETKNQAYQWHLDDSSTYGGIHMESAWDISTGNPSVVVAVVDTGVAYENYPAPNHWHIDTYNAYGGTGHSWWCGVKENSNWYSPPGYSNLWEQYLVHEIDLTGATGSRTSVTLSFQHKYDMELNYDKGYVEVSDNNGASWTQLASYTGNSAGWKAKSLDLTAYKSKIILLRFRFHSDSSYSDGDGYYDSDGAWYIDNVRVIKKTGGTETELFYDNMESGIGSWQVDSLPFQKAPDLAGTSFWINSDEISGDGVDNDSNGYIDDINGWDFINSDTHPNDDNAHGTHVSGTIAQTTNNSLGIAGVAFNTTLMPVKVLGPAGGTYQQVADGIYYAANNGAKVINMSLGGSGPSTVLEDAVVYAYNNGVTVIAACGNGGIDGIGDPSCDYPAAYNSYVIAVGATQYDETKAPYSNYGTSLDIVAPGGNTSLDQNGDGYKDGVLQQTFGNTFQDWGYWFYQGTSMATPHVSGVAALILSLQPNFTPNEVRTTLESNAEDKGPSGWDSTYGWGIVDAKASLGGLIRSNFPANSWRMISIPFLPSNPDPEAVLSDDLGTIFYDWILAQWQPQEAVYKYHKATCCPWAQSETSILSIAPGSAYWLTTRLGPYNIDAVGTLVPDQNYNIHLLSGWNQIGDPFNYNVDWVNSQVKYGEAIEDIGTPEADNWVKNNFWWYDGSQYLWWPEGGLSTSQLKPWEGYWVRSLVECYLIIPPISVGGSSAQTSSESALEQTQSLEAKQKEKEQKWQEWLKSNKGIFPQQKWQKFSPEWKLQLLVIAGSKKDTYNFAGLSLDAQDNYDVLDVLEPPPITSGVNLYFPHQDWSFNPGNYAQDIKRAHPGDKTKEWDFEIKSDIKNTPVTLQWLGLDQIQGYNLSLVDLDTNQNIDIYNTPTYTYNSGEGGIKHFKLTAEMEFKTRR